MLSNSIVSNSCLVFISFVFLPPHLFLPPFINMLMYALFHKKKILKFISYPNSNFFPFWYFQTSWNNSITQCFSNFKGNCNYEDILLKYIPDEICIRQACIFTFLTGSMAKKKKKKKAHYILQNSYHLLWTELIFFAQIHIVMVFSDRAFEK